VPSLLPKIQAKLNDPLRKNESPRYEIMPLAEPKNYPVKYDVDMNDPGNLGDNPP
jgi:hypothetical protein